MSCEIPVLNILHVLDAQTSGKGSDQLKNSVAYNEAKPKLMLKLSHECH